MKQFLFSLFIFTTSYLSSQEQTDKFKQLKQELPTPNVYRTASGAPGHQYYQQKANYLIDVTVDDEKQVIYGTETITYKNNSPDPLAYLWLQLDQNVRSRDSDSKLVTSSKMKEKISFEGLARFHNDFDGGFKIEAVTNGSGKTLDYTINKTMMRVDLPSPLTPGNSYTLKIKWWYNINNRGEIGGRSGYEYFEEDDNRLYAIAQFYPRMAVYNETEGWQNKQFLGRGEFALPFGDFKVNITVPSNHIVGATGVLTNASTVLTPKQRSRLKKAQSEYKQPIFIVSQEEAEENEKTKSSGTKTWSFQATNVRDFAFATSKKFIWDAMSVKVENNNVLAMSFYPKEGNPLWEKYSTKVVAHTISSYSNHTINYPYPVAISVHTDKIGMEYPMICFNGGRPEADGTYSKFTKYGMIGVIIHEVGHNFFPMIINSDERQWTWMDEGLNTFVQYLAEQEWERDYPSRRGPAHKIVTYMKGDKESMVPIMTNSEALKQFGNNAYSKPATALNILRETIMGRELFDFAFKTYCERWRFKHPTPADFFRTMEDASGVDLDWFWRGWFYTTDHVDIGIKEVAHFKIDSKNPAIEKAFKKEMDTQKPDFIGKIRNKKEIETTYSEKDTSILDFYNKFDPYAVDEVDKETYEGYRSELTEKEIALLESDFNYYMVTFENLGGLVMPLLVDFTFEDGTSEEIRIPAEIWRKNSKEIAKVFFFKKEVTKIAVDKRQETADVDTGNNYWPPQPQLSKFKLYKRDKYDSNENLMQRAIRNDAMKKEE